MSEVLGYIDSAYGGYFYPVIFCLYLIIGLFFLKEQRKPLLIPALIISIIIVNPLFCQVWERLNESKVYWRTLWMIPIIPVCALLIAAPMEKTDRKPLIAGSAAVCLLAIILCGHSVYGYWQTDFASAENPDKLPGDVVEIADYLLEQTEYPGIVSDGNLSAYFRQYSGKIRSPYGRGATFGYQTEFGARVYSHLINNEMHELAQIMRKNQYEYLVTGKPYEDIPDCFEQIAVISGYGIYTVSTDEKKEDVWKLTQYPDDSGKNAMFYSLINSQRGEVILIDGGWTYNADRVSKVIEKNGGHVTAWFLTHYHGDHCGAFNTLWEKYKDRIDVIYATPLVWEDFEATAQYWDTPETFSTFLEQTKDSDKVRMLSRGDQFEIDGLKVSVFNAYDDVVRKYPDIANNCSLVFKISTGKQAVLFLGDAHEHELGKEMLDQFGAEAMQADYVQAAHHGNNTQSREFYLAVKPSVMFLDGPEWLMTGERYDAKDLLAWCREQGITTYDYRQAPTTVILEAEKSMGKEDAGSAERR